MNFETYNPVITNIDTCIRPMQSVSFHFDGRDGMSATRLFLTGETNISPFWKTEPDYQMLYRRIDDSLRSDIARKDRFCLDLSGGRCQYPKIAFKKLVAPFRTPMFVLNDCTDTWRIGISAKVRDLTIYGYLRVCVEVRFKKDGVDKHSTVGYPDCTFNLDIPDGSYDWTSFHREIVIDTKNVANICYFIEGEDYEGELYLEAPEFVSAAGYNLVGQFLPHTEDRQTVNWMGQNLSHIEWIGLRVDINDKLVFDGEIFERCHRFSEAELSIPEGVVREGVNTIKFTCTSDYRDAAGYVLHEWGFIAEKPTVFISAPECITIHEPFFICIEGKKGDKIELVSDTVKMISDPVLMQDGLNVLRCICDTALNDIHIELNGENIIINRCVEKDDDGVLTGTGDMVYIPVEAESVSNYLKWYLSNNIGNLLTIRPTYRWNGTRTINSEVYRNAASLLDSMGIRYSHMLDGRELPGCNANPLVEEIESEHFLGRQTHEFDGQFVYWGDRDVTGDLSGQMFYDLFLRMDRKYSDRMHHRYVPENVFYTPQKQYIFKSPEFPTDMQSAAQRFVKSLRDTRKAVTRHTGPSTLFKYFYQAGYKWVGAELMYSPTELTVAALRGASSVYGGKTGAHLAVQWSTSPHDTEYRYRRYRLALFISYMQGIDEINTEEGLWRLEEYYHFHHRFSDACKNHTLQQQDFYRYICTHTRRGSFYTPIAFLSGRYDGWRCFGRRSTWGLNSFGFSDAEKAWDLLTFFYPKSVLDSIYKHNCSVEELGYYSGTPHGNVDIIPIEAESFSKYRLLIAAGYNKAQKEDMQKLRDFVMQGGTLLIGWPQLFDTVERSKMQTGEFSYYDGEERRFCADTYRSFPVSVCEVTEYDEVILYTDSHKPLVVKKIIGEGCVYLVNAKEYAGIQAVDLAYRDVLEKLTAKCIESESIYAKGSRNVQFTVFERRDGSRDVYFIATDWHKECPDGTGTLMLGDHQYDIPVSWGQLVKITAYGDSAIYPQNDGDEVISFDGAVARVQGAGIATFVVLKDGSRREITVDFSTGSVQEICL